MLELRYIDMSNNALLTITEYDLLFFHNCYALEEIILSENRISVIPQEWKYLRKLCNLKLDHNNFTEYKDFDFFSSNVMIDVTNNNISTINVEEFERIAAKQCVKKNNETSCPGGRVEIVINRNSLNCDCQLYNFTRYVQSSMLEVVYKYVKFEPKLMSCSEPDHLKGIPLKEVNLTTMTCRLKKCPAGCKCDFRAFDNAAIVNCSNAQLTEVPSSLPYESKFSHIEVILANNEITSLSLMANLSAYKNVTRFDLSHNRIDRINMSHFSPKLQVLNLDNNQFSYLDNNTLTVLNTFQYLQQLTLHGNPWKCNCDTPLFTHFLQDHIKQISDFENITCENSGQQIIKLSKDILCPISHDAFSHYTFIAGIALATFGLMFALYYRYKQEIRVWLFAHKLCLWLVAEKEIDKDKKYDAFISYSHMDESFIVDHLVPHLEEGGSRPFKLCLHYRDWIPGEFIPNQIVASVENSRRTIVVLSLNFLNSVWGKMEFRMAYVKAMKEGCARVIVILYTDVDTNKLDAELKAYLTTNTYLKWGDPWFWNKLRYALPHSLEYCEQQFVRSTWKSLLSLNTSRSRSSGENKKNRKMGQNLMDYTKQNTVPLINGTSSE